MKKHIPAPGRAKGLEGVALCGRWGNYDTGDHELIRDNARTAKSMKQADHYCRHCLNRL